MSGKIAEQGGNTGIAIENLTRRAGREQNDKTPCDLKGAVAARAVETYCTTKLGMALAVAERKMWQKRKHFAHASKMAVI
jgi:hypothetical protein